MIESEWVSWEPCPRCGKRAAVGWSNTGRSVDPIEFDCPGGCVLNICELARTFPPWSGTLSDERAGRVEQHPVEDMSDASEVACDAVRRGAAAITIAGGLGGAARVTAVWRAKLS